MISCIAIDDEPLALKQLAGYIKKTPFLNLVAMCHSVSEAKAVLETQSVDAIFTDIQMPDCSGMQFVKSLNPMPLVVFSTAYEEYAVEGFRIDAIDYLLKPYGYQDFQKAALKVKQYCDWRASASENAVPQKDDFIFIRANNKSMKVVFSDILYVEAMSEYIRIHFVNGSSVMTFMSLKLMADTLPDSQFMRIHRSYLIALQYIVDMHRNEVEISNGIKLPVSATYKEELQSFISSQSVGR